MPTLDGAYLGLRFWTKPHPVIYCLYAVINTYI